jgi:sec-independent protein translocase protein TatB
MGIGWGELLVIGLVAVVFIGPKDLPVVLNKLGGFLRQVKTAGNQVVDAISKEAEDPKKYIKDLNGNLQETFKLDDIKK